MKTQITDGLANINFWVQVPAPEALTAEETLSGLLTEAGHDVLLEDDVFHEDDGASFTVDEVFPEGCPAMALRGLRVREGTTQEEMSSKLGIAPKTLEQLESGRRPISVTMAKRIEKAFDIPYKVFMKRATTAPRLKEMR